MCQRPQHGAWQAARLTSGGVPSTCSTTGRPESAKGCPPLSRQQQSRRSRSPTSTSRLPPLACKNTLPPEGHSPASHINARVSCACEQCLLALHAAPQTRGIALQAAHQRDLNSVIPEGDEELATRCSSLVSPGKRSPAKPSPGKSIAAPAEYSVGYSKCCVCPVPEALAPGDSHTTLSTAAPRTATDSPVACSGNASRDSSSLRHCHSHKAAVHAVTDNVREDSSPADTVLAWYTPFSSTSDLCEREHAEEAATAACGGHEPKGSWKCAGDATKRTCSHGAQHGGRQPSSGSGSAARCASNGSQACMDSERSPRRKNIGRSGLMNSSSSKQLQTRSSQCAPQSSTSDLQRSVTCQNVPTPFAEPSAQLPSHVSGCTSAELASLCLPSVTLTTTILQTQAPVCDTSPGRLNSCPSLPAAPWASGQAVA